MPQSISCVFIHLVFSTKYREPMLLDTFRPDLHAYMAGILKKVDCVPVAINSVEDHIHILFILSRKIPLSQVVKEVKQSSSKWIKGQHPSVRRFTWQRGYATFSVDAKGVHIVKRYIAKQREHHGRRSFKQEYRLFLDTYGAEYDEQYVWD